VTINGNSRRVVVGVSSFYARLAMVRWAADEAAARRAELRLVTVCATPALPDQYLPADSLDARRAAAERLLADLVRFVATSWPGLRVTTELAEGPVAAALRVAAEGADLLVVGADDASMFVEALAGSVPGDLLTTAPCPLAVVPRREWTELTALPASAPVVVALDEQGTAQSALAFGFAAASRSGRPLSVLQCVPADSADGANRSDQRRTVTGFDELYPDVAVTTEITAGDPTDALVAASRTAALLVLGSRGRGRLASTLFGSVGRALIRRSGCPVVVARPRPEPHRHHLATG
jgi:nucleotide-binding universal stress UspA family protein